MDLFSLFLLTHENNEIKSPTKIYDFTVYSLTCILFGVVTSGKTVVICFTLAYWHFRQREYIPPDVPGYMDLVVWPEYLSHLEELKSEDGIGKLLTPIPAIMQFHTFGFFSQSRTFVPLPFPRSILTQNHCVPLYF